LVARTAHDARRARRLLGGEGHRVGFEPQVALAAEELELVTRARLDPGHEQLPHAGGPERAHRVNATVPPVEVADHAHGACIGRPHRERRAVDALVLAHVRAEVVPELLVATLADEVEVELTERWPEAVRVLEHERAVLRVGTSRAESSNFLAASRTAKP